MRVHRFLIPALLVMAGAVFAGNLKAQAIGSQAGNIPFAQEWQVPSGITSELNDYFVSPGYVTLLELWGIN
jgi:hypothetical protein